MHVHHVALGGFRERFATRRGEVPNTGRRGFRSLDVQNVGKAPPLRSREVQGDELLFRDEAVPLHQEEGRVPLAAVVAEREVQ